MPALSTLLSFTLLSLGVILVPGPTNLFILGQGIGQGRRTALAALIGVELASALRVIFTAAGLSALLASSAIVFGIIRWTGVVYLLALAVIAWRTTSVGALSAVPRAPETPLRSARKGLIVALANPKMIIFFVALFPQFIHPDQGPIVTQMLILGTVFWAIGAVWDLGMACASATFGRWLRRWPQAQSAQPRIEGFTYAALAGWSATT